MATPIREFSGLKATGIASPVHKSGLLSLNPGYTTRRATRTPLVVQSFKKQFKKKQLVLLEDVDKLGKKGELVTVALGYWRNYLAPFRKAKVATPDILAAIQAEKDAEERRRAEIKDKATRMAVALKTIGKFIIKKRAGEGGAIFGSVTSMDIVNAVYQQTGQTLEKRDLRVPQIRALGSYDVSIKLHPEVVGTFKVVVTQEKNVSGRK